MDWELITETDFYYQIIYPPRVPFEDYAFVRLKPMDKTLYDLTEKYISPIGYLSNNMFVSEWNYNDYGHLSFNDLLEFFYRVRNDDFFYEDNFETVREPYFHTYIPAELFEETVLPYFDISLQEFRKRSLYDSEKNVYPWQEICCDNVTYYPSVEPEVVSCKENDDNTNGVNCGGILFYRILPLAYIAFSFLSKYYFCLLLFRFWLQKRIRLQFYVLQYNEAVYFEVILQ